MRRRGGPLRAWPLAFLISSACASSSAPAVEQAPAELVSRPPASPSVLRGEQLLSEGDVEQAQKLFEQAIADDPDDARAWLDLGLAREAAGDPASAEKAYLRATELDSRFAEAFNNLGVLMRERGALENATVLLERAAALDPELTAARFNLALAYEDQGELEKAEREYHVTIQQRPDDPVPHINLSMMLLHLGRADEAAVELRAARPLVRDDVLLSIAVGEGFRRARSPEEAVGVLRNALDLAEDPPPTELLAELALAYYAVGDLTSAEETMRRAIGQDQLDPALQYAYGSILAKQGQLGKARAHLRRAVKLDPEGPYAERAQARLQSLK